MSSNSREYGVPPAVRSRVAVGTVRAIAAHLKATRDADSSEEDARELAPVFGHQRFLVARHFEHLEHAPAPDVRLVRAIDAHDLEQLVERRPPVAPRDVEVGILQAGFE